ncbi:Mitochondrial enolase super member 1 [Saguinus oedipus]|uniref:Mitochondrial enolase super member 1 n=1 Tax=Saguinus oedipus TaxID=9490 RepID=A0ABQ9UD94_SAGOE|nr:Mitochondrial enolase super member 1 [Saguinus oedipus]
MELKINHTDPDYSAAYVIIETDAEDGLKGCGITFTLGKGTEVVVCAVNALAHHVLNKDLSDIVGDFRGFYRQLASDGQLRWIGPEKGVVHLATAAILNAVWDLWAKQEGKPVWKLLVDMVSRIFNVTIVSENEINFMDDLPFDDHSLLQDCPPASQLTDSPVDPRTLVSCIDFRYITDVLTEEDALEEQMLAQGYPAYTTSCAWLGYSDDTLKQLCTQALKDGWTRPQQAALPSRSSKHQSVGEPVLLTVHEELSRRGNGKTAAPATEVALATRGAPPLEIFWSVGDEKFSENNVRPLHCRGQTIPVAFLSLIKVGADLQDDERRCQLIRDVIGPEKTLMMDANQRWDVPEAVEWMSKLAKFKPLWIEEPTSPDDILGHATISKGYQQFEGLLQGGYALLNASWPSTNLISAHLSIS